MSVNFCLPELQPKISTSAVCADGHGVENLLNYNPLRGGWKGFMAESFIKPPIDITVEFPINICIEKIVLDPCVGRQKSSGFEIYSASVPLHQGSSSNGKQKSDKTTSIFTRIANTVIPWSSMSQNNCTLRFTNNIYRASFPDIIRLSPVKQDVRGPGDIDRFLRLAAPGAVQNVNHVTIRITRSHSGSVLALRRLEVWGEPSLRIPKQSQLWALKIIQNLFTRKDVTPKKGKVSDRTKKSSDSSPEKKPNSNSDASQSSSHGNSNEDANECPEDFLDPITCQMMMLPVLLPSGHTVDRSTQDKHNKVEAVWGRPPNDPFTGVAFTSKSQPVPNVKLKTRLDQYLLKSGDKHKLLARDVGRTSNETTSGPSASTLVMPSATQNQVANLNHTSQQTKATKRNGNYELRHSYLPLFNANTSAKLTNLTPKTYLPNNRKRVIDSGVDFSTSRQPLAKKTKPAAALGRWNPHPLSMPAESLQSTTLKTDFKSHEDSLTDSLDSALNQALGSLPSYSRTLSDSVSKANKELSVIASSSKLPPQPSCSVCHTEVNTALNGATQPALSLYRLPCTHLICRTCLVTTATNQSSAPSFHDTRFCASCGRTYRKEDVVRVHL